MGIFEKSFSKKPDGPEPEETPEKPPIKIRGELEQRVFTPESKEAPRIVRGQQFKFGKLLQESGGSIVPGFEHTTTGTSQELPQGRGFHPSELFSHRFQGTDGEYPWQEEGGEILKKLIEIDSRQYVVVARRMLRSESGENQPGRKYTEMHGLAIPAEEWSVAVVPQLVNVLEAKGVTEINKAMPVIELKTNLLDEPLPENWFDDYVKDLISHAVSGKPIALQEWDVSEKVFLQKLFHCLTCLPENIARQISFGAGLADLKEGEVRVAHTKRAWGVRKIAGQWRGTAPEDIDFGQKYLVSIANAIKDCKTPREIMKAVNNLSIDIRSEFDRRFKAENR